MDALSWLNAATLKIAPTPSLMVLYAWALFCETAILETRFSVSATQLTPIAGHNFSLSWSLATDEAIWVAMQAADVIMQQNSYSIHVWAVCHNVDTKPAALGIDTNIWCIATNVLLFCIYPQRILLVSQQQLSCTLFPTPVYSCM